MLARCLRRPRESFPKPPALYCQDTARAQDKFGIVSWVPIKTSIVGYTSKDTLPTGKNIVGGSFISIGAKDSFKLTDLVVNVPEDKTCSGEFILQTLTADGRTDKSYAWFKDKKHGGEKGGVAGWYDEAGKVQFIGDNDVEFDAGTCFWTLGGGFTLQSAGAVLTETVKTPTLPTGKVLVGNPYPMAVNLTDLYVEVPDGQTCSGEFIFQTLTADGRTDQSYAWFKDKKHGGEKGGVEGWYDEAGKVQITKESGILLGAGEGYWTLGNGFTVVFPKIDL